MNLRIKKCNDILILTFLSNDKLYESSIIKIIKSYIYKELYKYIIRIKY